jgi:hypothetical protein
MRFQVVITTIQNPTDSLQKMASEAGRHGAKLTVMGDRKGPESFDLEHTELFTIDRQRQLPHTLAKLLPENHYSRKNLGYLEAIKGGADCIFETDDDNHPSDNWQPKSLHQQAQVVGQKGWCNVYRYFSDENIWPRGFPLECIQQEIVDRNQLGTKEDEFPIQQLLADGSPDVDAIWRLVLDREISFKKAGAIALPEGTWCPFNSQATWWWPQAFHLMYLPSFCSFRMTDIWRSFVAQRCLWADEKSLLFNQAEMYQERNDHNLMKDFSDEIDGYLNNADIATCLEKTQLEPGQPADNLLKCYETLVKDGFIPESEIQLVQAWNKDLQSVCDS